MKTNFDWPAGSKPTQAEQEANLRATDPEAIKTAIGAMFGDQIGSMIREQVLAAMREAGVTEVDRRHLRFPEGTQQAAEEADLTDVRGWDVPAVRMKRRGLMDQWFRAVLFGRKPGDAVLVRTLSEGTDSEGGYLVPPGWIGELTRDVPKLSQLYQHVRRIPVPNNAGEMPTVATNATVYWGTENNDFTGGDPALGTATYAVKRLNAIVKLSRELASDANPDIVGVVESLFNEAIAAERDRVIAIGTGSGQPMGLYSATGITDVSSVTTLTYDNLVNLHESVDHRYFADPSCRWVCNQNVKAALMKIKDDDGQPIFHVDPTKGYQGTIFGHPISIEAGCYDNFIFFGALRYYIWFDRQTLAVERTSEGGDAFLKHQLWIKFFERADGKPVLPVKVPLARSRVLTGITSLT